MRKLRLAALMVMVSIGVLAQGTLTFDAPPGWKSQPVKSSMRVAQFLLPKVEGDAEDATLVVYYFGGQGGSVEDNFQRWTNQCVQPDGRPSAAVATKSSLTANGLKISVLDVNGTYMAEMSPGSAEHHNNPNFHLKGAVVETPNGPYFIKLTGPQKTVSHWDKSVTEFLKSLRTK